jgi:hypothetical protein
LVQHNASSILIENANQSKGTKAMIIISAPLVLSICNECIDKTSIVSERAIIADVYSRAYIAKELSGQYDTSLVSLAKVEADLLLDIKKRNI